MTGIEHLLPHRLGGWLLTRLGIYLSVAIGTTLFFLIAASLQSGLRYPGYTVVLGTLTGLAAAVLCLFALRGISNAEKRITIVSDMNDPATIVRYRLKAPDPEHRRIDRAIAGAMIALLLRALAAGADPKLMEQTLRNLHPPRD
jgi:hypothetical protein